MAFYEASQDDDAAMLAGDHAPDALDRKFCHIVDTVKLVLGVPAAFVVFPEADRHLATEAERAPLGPLVAAAREGEGPLAVADIHADPRFALAMADAAARACLAVPFRRADGSGGVLCAVDTRVRVFTAHEMAILTNLARCVVSELDLYDRATRDDLTGVMRRRPFMRALGEMMARYRLAGTEAVLSIIDLDHFKRVNDEHGHVMGDRVLRVVSDTFRDVLGRDVPVARLGGEEFAAAFPATTLPQALEPLTRLQGTLARLRFADRPALRVTASFGVCALHPALPNVSAWCKLADAALYGAKQAGRNQVRVGYTSDAAAEHAAAPGPSSAEALAFALAG